jgi:uracil-DNA glycosylase family 4
MKRLPLYPRLPQAILGATPPQELDKTCIRCGPFAERSRTKCMSPEGDPGGVLIVGEYPDRVADQTGRPFTGPTSMSVRKLVQAYWPGPVAFDHAIKCSPGIEKLKDKHFENCRPYGARVLQDVNPQRIVCLGNAAMKGVLGRGSMMTNVRRGYGWWVNDEGIFVPVFLMLSPSLAYRNRFMREQFDADLKWALTVKTPTPKFDQMATWLVERKLHATKAQSELSRQPWVTYDVETFGKMGNGDFRIESCTLLGADSQYSWTWTRQALKDRGCNRVLKDILEKSSMGTQNGKYDDRSAHCYLGAEVDKVYADSRLLRKLLDFEASAALEPMAELVGMGGHKQEAQTQLAEIIADINYHSDPPSGSTPTGKVRKLKPKKFTIEQSVYDQVKAGSEAIAFAYGYMPEKILYRYNARDVYSTREVIKYFLPKVQANPGIKMVWDEIIRDASKAVRWIEDWGFGVDREAMKQFAEYCTGKETESLIKLRVYGDFNPGSPVQLREFLFGKLGLRHHKLTDTNLQSTDKEVLEDFRDKHPAVEHLINFRKFSKLNGTYGRGMLRHIRDDERIHASYLLDGAGTGRLSSSDPNQQNAPRANGSLEGKMYRDCYVAAKDHMLLEFDQSQIELRVAAMLSNDTEMINDYKKGIDIHRNNARECCEIAWGIPKKTWDKMTKDEQDPYRSKAKVVTFGRLYGKSDRGLAEEFGCSVEEVQKINQRIWGRYHKLESWTQECIAYSRRTGETFTWWKGRRARTRHIWKIADHDKGIQEHAERTSYNSRIQGTAADFTTASLWPIVSWILDEGVPAKLVATVHDSVVLEAHESVVAEVIVKVKGIMTGHDAGGVPLVSDCKIGPSWGSMVEHKQ